VRLYGSLDLAFAALYAWMGFVVAPGRSTAFSVALGLVIAGLAIAGAGLIAEQKWARKLAIAVSIVQLAFAAILVLLMIASAAYLKGVYGSLGQGIAIVTILVAALIVEGFALLPIFQLRFLLKK
jgi:hypothetical protein